MGDRRGSGVGDAPGCREEERRGGDAGGAPDVLQEPGGSARGEEGEAHPASSAASDLSAQPNC